VDYSCLEKPPESRVATILRDGRGFNGAHGPAMCGAPANHESVIGSINLPGRKKRVA